MQSKLTQSLLCFILTIVTLILNAQVYPTPALERLKNQNIKKQLSKRSLLDSVQFRNIGPSVMSGRVVDLEVNPADPTEFYVAYASGGVWYTHNNGQSFNPIFDSSDVLTIGDIAVNWKSGIIWIGTGEVNSSRSSYAGIGVYKSSDNGKTWKYMGLPESHHIGKIQLHPFDDNTVWVAVLGHLYSSNKERGVYKTTDGGNTWKQTLYIDENTGAVDIDINPFNPLEIYASTWYRTRRASNFTPSGATSGIYKSIDGGNTWKQLNKTGSGFPEENFLGRTGIAVYPKDPRIIYAVVDNQRPKPDTAKKDTSKYILNDFKKLTKEQFSKLNDKKLDTFFYQNGMAKKYSAKEVKILVATGRLKPSVIYDYLYINDGFQGSPVGCEVYRSDNAGLTWKKMNVKDLFLYNTYGYYFGKIFISPVNDQKIVITGFDIELSNDGGKTFKKIGKENVHPDHHVAWINPKRDSHIIIGNDGGCNITYDNGDHWFKANTPAVGQFYSVFADNDKPYNVYGGLQDNGVWYGSSTSKNNYAWYDNGSNPFKQIIGGDGMQVQVDTRNNTTTYAGIQFGYYAKFNRLDPDNTAKFITPHHELGEKPFRFNWQTPVLISKHNQDIIYFGGDHLFQSFNSADTLISVSPDLTHGDGGGNVPYGTITAITESPLRFSLLYVGTDDGNIQISKDGASSWKLLNDKNIKGLPPALKKGLWVSRLVASKYKESRIYIALNGYRNDNFNHYLYVSDDYGNSWKEIGTDLPIEPINVMREDPKNENILYIGTDGGLYVSFDRGNSFMMWNCGLPFSVPIHDIAIQERENEIILGTHGRSIYIAKLDDVQALQIDKDWLKKKPKKDNNKKQEDLDEETQEKD